MPHKLHSVSHEMKYVYVIGLFIYFRVTSLALGQEYDCPSSSDITLKGMGKVEWLSMLSDYNKTQQHTNRMHISWDVFLP